MRCRAAGATRVIGAVARHVLVVGATGGEAGHQEQGEQCGDGALHGGFDVPGPALVPGGRRARSAGRLASPPMAFETVTGYCWPQSVAPGETVGLHLSSAGDRPVPSRWLASAAAARCCGPRPSAPSSTPPPTAPTPTAATGRSPWPIDVGDDLAVGLPRGRPHHRRRRQVASHEPRLLRRAAEPSARPTRSCCSWRQHHARLQRLRRPQPLHRRHHRVAAAADVARLPAQAAGAGPAGDQRGPRRPADDRPRRLPPAQPPVALRRLVRLARLGAAVPRVGRAGGLRHRRGPQRRPRGVPRARRALPADPVGRPRRVLVRADARHGRGPHRPGRQRRLLLRQHLALAGAHGGPGPVRTGRRRWWATRAASTTTRCSAPTARPSSPPSGPTTCSSGPRTT